MACGRGKKKKDIARAIGIIATLGFMLCATGCEQLKQHKDEIHAYIINLMQGDKGSEAAK